MMIGIASKGSLKQLKSGHALVAGGAGFLGSHLVDRLVDEGFAVTMIDSLVTGQRENVSASTQRLADRDERLLKLIEGDIRLSSSGWMAGLQERERDVGAIDRIYNLASPASPVDFCKMPVYIIETGFMGHRNLLNLARERNCPILFASSSEVYGDALEHPQRESYFGNVNPFGHRSCYDEAKRVGETLSLAWKTEHRVSIRIARIFNTYGPRMRLDDGRIITNFGVQALQGQSLTVYGDGSQTRSFCFVSDQVDGLFRLMESHEDTPVNIGSQDEHSALEIANRINRLTGNQAPIRFLPLPPNDPKVRRPDTTKAASRLGWSIRVGLEEGIKQTIQDFAERLKSSGRSVQTPNVEVPVASRDVRQSE